MGLDGLMVNERWGVRYTARPMGMRWARRYVSGALDTPPAGGPPHEPQPRAVTRTYHHQDRQCTNAPVIESLALIKRTQELARHARPFQTRVYNARRLCDAHASTASEQDDRHSACLTNRHAEPSADLCWLGFVNLRLAIVFPQCGFE